LLDFGIAKLLSEDDQPDSPMTQIGLRAMTPEYAAPEQIRRDPVSTATDVHALGLVLFELLTGVHPFWQSRSSREELIRSICDTEPERPSRCVEAHPEALEGHYGLRPAALRRRLQGEIDTIILKALAKEPGRRYATVEALADDLHRYREGLPIKARRDTLAYRTGRFLRRHRVVSAATLAVLVSLVASLVAVWQQSRLTAIEAQRSERSLEFLTDLFQSGDPRQRAPLETIAELLDEGTRQVVSEMEDDPVLQGSLLLRLAEVRLGRTEFEQAAELADRALPLLEARLNSPDRRIADALRVAGASRYVRTQNEQVATIMRAAAEQYRAVGDPVREAEALSAVAGTLRSTEGYQAALDLQRAVVDRLESELGPDDPALASARYALGVFASDAGEYELAERELRRAMELNEQRAEDGELERTDIALTLAGLLDRAGRSDEAGVLFQDSLDSYRRLLGDDSPTVASTRFSLGLFQLGQHRPELAEVELRAVIAAPSASPMTRAHARRYLGVALIRQQRLDEAMAVLTEAQAAYRALGGTSATGQAWRAQADYGYARTLSGDAEAASPVLEEAVAGIESSRGTEHYELILPLSYLALALDESGQVETARGVAERAIGMANKLLGQEHRISQEVRERHTALLDQPLPATLID